MKKGQKKGDYKLVKLSQLSGNSTLSKEILSSVENFMMEGLTTKEICEKLEIPRSTWETWRLNNTAGFNDFLVNTRREVILSLAEENILSLQKSNDEKVKLDAAKFATERLGKQWYSTRQETRQVEKQETLEEIEQERLNKLLEKPQAKPIETPYQEKAL